MVKIKIQKWLSQLEVAILYFSLQYGNHSILNNKNT
jgi:hypothetical protein